MNTSASRLDVIYHEIIKIMPIDSDLLVPTWSVPIREAGSKAHMI